jgi:hypothetical protein
VDHFKDSIKCVQCGSVGHVAHTSTLEIGDAVAAAFTALTFESKIHHDAAVIIHNLIKAAQYRQKNESHLPPLPSGIGDDRATNIPDSLLDFVSMTISNKPLLHSSVKSQTGLFICRGFVLCCHKWYVES